jgi:hypothetical protein
VLACAADVGLAPRRLPHRRRLLAQRPINAVMLDADPVVVEVGFSMSRLMLLSVTRLVGRASRAGARERLARLLLGTDRSLRLCLRLRCEQVHQRRACRPLRPPPLSLC